MSTLTEQPGLLDRVASGDRDGMRRLIEQYSGLVWSIVRRKIANAADAEDLVQDIFAEIWKSAHRYKPDMGSEDTFIAVITRRRVIDAIRRSTRRAPAMPFDGAIEYSLGDKSAPEQQSDISPIMQIMEKLSPQRRSVLELSVIYGRSHSQIVEATGMPLGTVKAHIRRGLEEIRTQLSAADSSSSTKGVSS